MWQVKKLFSSSLLSFHRTDAILSPTLTFRCDSANRLYMCEDRSAGHDRVQRGTDAHHIAIT